MTFFVPSVSNLSRNTTDETLRQVRLMSWFYNDPDSLFGFLPGHFTLLSCG